MLKQCLQLSSRVRTCEWLYVLHNFVAVVMCFAAQKENFGVTVWTITGGWVGKGWDFVNVKTGKDNKTETEITPSR